VTRPGKPDATSQLERAFGVWVRARLPLALAEVALFFLKQAWACLFGALMLAGIILSKALWQADWPLQRYDALLLYALAIQIVFLRLGLETWQEARVILLFHLTGTAMEWFKVGAGSWSYPEPGLFKIMDVPLFSGFMYASVGSYIARVIRLFEMRFIPYPPFWATVALAAAIYVNFFAHHFLADVRILLIGGTLVLFWRTRIWFRAGSRQISAPLPLAAFLTSLSLWVAENIGTTTGTWLYFGQTPDQLVSFAKIGSWYLLIYVSFVTVTLASREALHPGDKARTRP
jgi:uncharacterized membrane protein YoaT (DUF817 family)